MDDDLTEKLVGVGAETIADKAIKDDGDFLPFMDGTPAGSKFVIKTCVNLLAGAPVLLMMKIGRRFSRGRKG